MECFIIVLILDLSLFDINKDTDIRFMLYKCHNLMNVNGINIKYGNNKIFCSFSECENLYEYKQIKSSMKNEYFNFFFILIYFILH